MSLRISGRCLSVVVLLCGTLGSEPARATPPCGARASLGDEEAAAVDTPAEPETTPAELQAAAQEGDPSFRPASVLLEMQPERPRPPRTGTPEPVSEVAQYFEQVVFADDEVRRSLIPAIRREQLYGPGTDLVFGSESRFRVTTDTGNLLGQSLSTAGVASQLRTPIITDTRVRGNRNGRLLASGSYWIPARQDLDTLLSKIDSRIVQDVIVIKGPYTARLGPGFSFVDFQLLETPRYECGPEAHGSTSLEYKTNGEQWYGRQSFWGGGSDWGFRIGYGRRTGNDYHTGSSAFDAGGLIPSSYNSGDLDVAFGYDFSPDSRLEFTYLQQDQWNVEFPGLVFDINRLIAQGYELKYSLANQPEFELWTVEGWYNRTAFTGDTSRAGKIRQIPTVNSGHLLAPGQFLTTDVDGISTGYRTALTWGAADAPQLTIGTDLIRVSQQLNDIVPAHVVQFFWGPVTLSQEDYPIPRSDSTDVGLFVEHSRPLGERVKLHTGARVDLVTTDARERVPGMGDLDIVTGAVTERSLSDIKQADLEQNFVPWSLFATLDYEINCCWTLTGGAGYAMRPPTLTELYAAGPFIGSLQPGLTYVEGDPELKAERLTQLDLGLRMDYGATRARANAFYAWVHDYITYDDIGERYQAPFPAYQPGVDYQHVAYTNTDLATLTGFELTGERDFGQTLTGFAVVSYVRGEDRARSTPSRIGVMTRAESPFNDPTASRSYVDDADHEPLPGIPPLEARVGLRLHEACPNPAWGVELESRMVAAQNRVASSLSEAPTPGFTVWNVRGFWRPWERLSLCGGVENFTDRFYREHLDYRAGRGVYRPGINYYLATEVVY